VVPTRDRSGYLHTALRSVAQLAKDDLPIEAIVVDDGSAKSPRPVVDLFGARLIASKGTGISAARNTGSQAARGEYILFLDDDDYLLGPVRSLLHVLQQTPGVAAAYGQIQTADSMLRPINEPYPMVADADAFRAFLGTCQQIGTVLCRKSVADAVGPFDEALESAEDWEWLLRLAMRYPVRCVLEPCLLFRQRPAGSADQMMLTRVPFTRRVYLRSVWRGGRRRPGWHHVLRYYVRNDGRWATHFLNSMKAHVTAGDAAGARFALLASIRSSPLHLVRSLVTDRGARAAAGNTLRSIQILQLLSH